MEKRPYTYVILRYRHDPIVGEFANVGVLLHEPKSGFIEAKTRHTIGRLSRIFPDVDTRLLTTTLKKIEQSALRFSRSERNSLLTSSNGAEAIAKTILPHDDSSFVWSSVGTGVTRDPRCTLDQLYSRFVAKYDEVARPHRDDAAVWKPVRDRLAELQLANRLEAKVIVSPVDRIEFEHAWKNGAWHCYQPLSFDLANEDSIKDKARKWAGQMLALKDSTEKFKTHFFVGLPSDENLLSAYQDAIGILKLSPSAPEVVEETHIEDFVRQIEIEILSHPELSTD